jgi:uncharacterized phage-associated protein
VKSENCLADIQKVVDPWGADSRLIDVDPNMLTAHIAARFIVRSTSEPVSNLKLQKLLYYAQGWHLGLHGTPLFSDEIQAWIHGPVVPSVFFSFRHFRWNPIEVPADLINIEDSKAAHIQSVFKAYGEFSATQLEALSHDESPWLEARKGLAPNEPSKSVITKDSMRVFFNNLATAQR